MFLGTENKVYVTFAYSSLNGSKELNWGEEIQLTDPVDSTAYNQIFRPNQINSFQIWLPNLNFVNYKYVRVSFNQFKADFDDILDDDWGIKTIRIHDRSWEYLYGSGSITWITKHRLAEMKRTDTVYVGPVSPKLR